MADVDALQQQNKDLQKEIALLRESLATTQKSLESANITVKAQEAELVTLRASLLASRRSISSEVKTIISPRASSPETIDGEGVEGSKRRVKSGFLPEITFSLSSENTNKESENERKEKRRSKSVHLMEPVHFAEGGNSNSKARSKTDSNSSISLREASQTGSLRESSDSLSSPNKSKVSRRQSIKLFSLGSLGKFRKSMSDLLMEQDPNVDTTTISGPEKAMNAANLYALLKVRPSYNNLMERKIIFNFFDDIESHAEATDNKTKAKSSPLNMITPKLNGYRVECSVGRTRNENHWRSKIEIERMEKLENYYAIYFLGKKHSNFIGFVKTDTPVIVSVLDEPETTIKATKSGERFFRAILWTPQREYKLFLETSQHIKPNKDGQLKKRDVIKLVFPLVKLTDVKVKRLRGTEIYSDLTTFEQHSKVTNIKAGVLYVKENQTEEDDIFGNVGGSPDFEEFLELLGDSVTLKGFSGFRGGLDVNNNTTGEKSVYTSWSGLEFMFHVTTLLPYFPLDTQHIERKRHLGNDIVNIVFKEGDTPFNPSIIRSTFTQVFIVVQKIKPLEEGGPTHYRMAVASKNGIPPFGPVLRSGFSSLEKSKFRDVLFTKICNGEMAALDSPVFEEKMTRTRLTLLTTVVKKCLKPDDVPTTPSKRGLKKSPSSASLFSL